MARDVEGESSRTRKAEWIINKIFENHVSVTSMDCIRNENAPIRVAVIKELSA